MAKSRPACRKLPNAPIKINLTAIFFFAVIGHPFSANCRVTKFQKETKATFISFLCYSKEINGFCTMFEDLHMWWNQSMVLSLKKKDVSVFFFSFELVCCALSEAMDFDPPPCVVWRDFMHARYWILSMHPPITIHRWTYDLNCHLLGKTSASYSFSVVHCC